MAKAKKTPVSFRLTDDELALLKDRAAMFDGNNTRAVVEGLWALKLGKTKLSKAQLLAELERRLK